MQRIFVFALVALALAHGAQAGRFSCYLSTWAVYRQGEGQFNIEDIPGDLCTHAIYSFVGVSNVTWEITLLDEGLDLGQSGLTRFTGLKSKFPGLKTIVSVGGWGEGGRKYSDLVSVPDRRATFIRSAVDFLNKYNFDGLDVDWEYPGVDYRGGRPEDKANFATFLREIRQALNQQGRGWELSIATSTVGSVLDVGYDVPSLCESVDVVNAMTYDLHGSWDGVANVHSALYDNQGLSIDGGVKSWVSRGCPANKVVIGIPFYGKSFNIGDGNQNHEIGTQIVGDGDAGRFTGAPGTLAYYEICENLNNGWTDRWDDNGQVPFAYQGHNWVGYDNVRSVQAKADYVRSNGLAGAMTWSIDLDDFNGLCGEKFPLSKAARSVV